jgi:excisionase family DNA binding protein
MRNRWTLPILIPMEEDKFWENMRLIIREEFQLIRKELPPFNEPKLPIPGLAYKPLLKTSELCHILQISRPTIYEWIRKNLIKPYKIESRVYFRWIDVYKLLNSPEKK